MARFWRLSFSWMMILALLGIMLIMAMPVLAQEGEALEAPAPAEERVPPEELAQIEESLQLESEIDLLPLFLNEMNFH